MKPVLLIVIDALASRIIVPAMKQGKLPTLRNLSERGVLREECISIFPSITPAATASIVTGRYPLDHGVVGAFFYDTSEDTVRYFGTDIWTILKEGFANYFNDFGIELNETVLQSKTMFDIASAHGLTSASLNYMIYHGQSEHAVNEPMFIKLWPGVKLKKSVHGPDIMLAGDFVSTMPREIKEDVKASGGVFNRYGFQDDTTGEVLLEMAKSDALADFTLAYFPDNDFESHQNGPAQAISAVENADRWLGKVIDAAGGFDNFLERRAVLVLGDHSQCDLIADAKSRPVRLDEVLTGFDLVDSGDKWTDDDQLMVCPNLRCAQIYLRRGYESKLEVIVKQLLSERRIDQVIWHRHYQDDRPTEFHVATADRGRLHFRIVSNSGTTGAKSDDDPGSANGNEFEVRASDDFGNTWEISGDLASVDAAVERGRLVYQRYPNALERIAGSFHLPASGDMWVTASPGYEFVAPGETPHESGSHGSLHESDSVTSLIAAGLPESVSVPNPIRTVDIANLCRDSLGLPADEVPAAANKIG